MSVVLDVPQKTLNPGRDPRLLNIKYVLPKKMTPQVFTLSRRAEGFFVDRWTAPLILSMQSIWSEGI